MKTFHDRELSNCRWRSTHLSRKRRAGRLLWSIQQVDHCQQFPQRYHWLASSPLHMIRRITHRLSYRWSRTILGMFSNQCRLPMYSCFKLNPQLRRVAYILHLMALHGDSLSLDWCSIVRLLAACQSCRGKWKDLCSSQFVRIGNP